MYINGIILGMVIFFGIGSLTRVLIGPTAWDRLLGYDLVSSKVVMAIVIWSYMLGETYLLDTAAIYALLGFVSILLIARFVERRGDI